jgi:hypothetical protein
MGWTSRKHSVGGAAAWPAPAACLQVSRPWHNEFIAVTAATDQQNLLANALVSEALHEPDK